MLTSLFRGLTAQPARGTHLFDAVTAEARRPHWYEDGAVPDTLDGRFAVLSTIAALVIVRLEDDGDEGLRASVELTERFIEVMESEHRELGMGDPTLGRTVRKLVSKLASRTGLWRAACAEEMEWIGAVRQSLYKEDPAPEALRHSTDALARLWRALRHTSVAELQQGKLG